MTGILAGKSALVTGGASGIGRATALAMAREGARVAVADMTEASAAATVALITAAGGQAIAIAGDVAKEADVAAMVARVGADAGDRLACQARVLASGVSVVRVLPAFAETSAAHDSDAWIAEDAGNSVSGPAA